MDTSVTFTETGGSNKQSTTCSNHLCDPDWNRQSEQTRYYKFTQEFSMQ